jgi:hypothetical protein
MFDSCIQYVKRIMVLLAKKRGTHLSQTWIHKSKKLKLKLQILYISYNEQVSYLLKLK